MRTIIFLFAIFLSINSFAEEQIYNGYAYSKPTLLEPFTSMPKNFGTLFSDSFSKDKLVPWAVIISSTVLMLTYDDEITKETKRFGKRLGIGNEENTRRMIGIGKLSLFRGPTDVGSAMYFIGDGWTNLALTTSFLGAGAVVQDYRALQTGAQLFQGLLMTGIVTQVIKRTTGRESPSSATSKTGVWRPLPSISAYNSHISKYDAFPSGHLATSVMTATIIATNYEEHTWVAPVAYSLCGALAFQMVNNGVHWSSDYPLAIGIGYMIGKSITKNGRRTIDEKNVNNKVTYNWSPEISADGRPMIAMNISY